MSSAALEQLAAGREKAVGSGGYHAGESCTFANQPQYATHGFMCLGGPQGMHLIRHMP